MKKTFTAAIIIANEQGTLPFSIEDKSPIAIASAVDEGLNRVKFSYKLANEDLDAIEVADKLIDATVARVITVADKVIERGVPVVLNRVCDVIAKVYPPASVFVPVIKNAEKFIVPAAKAAVRKGLNYVAEGAKTVVRSVAKGLVKAGKKLASWLGYLSFISSTKLSISPQTASAKIFAHSLPEHIVRPYKRSLIVNCSPGFGIG